MHIKVKYLIVFFVLIASVVSAQKKFVVYHVTGNVNIVTGNNAVTVKRGDIIAGNNLLQMSKNSSCMLIEEKGKSLQVTVEGAYTFGALQKMMLTAGNAGVTQKFFSYVYDNLYAGKKEDKLSIVLPVPCAAHLLLQAGHETRRHKSAVKNVVRGNMLSGQNMFP